MKLPIEILLVLSFAVPIKAHAAPIEVKPSKTHGNSAYKIPASILEKTPKIMKSGASKVSSNELDEVKQLDQSSNQEIRKFLAKNTFAVWDFTNQFDVKTGTAIKGMMLNSLVSSNLESPLLVETSEALSGIPSGSKFSCIGITKNKRVLAVCNKLITANEEYEVDTILLNNDGTAGLLGRAYSGKEQYAVGAITAAALKSALDVSLERVNTSFGTEQVTTTAKNKIKSGGIGALDEIVQMSTDEFKTQEPKISINAGKQVLIYFNRRFKL